MNELTDSLVAGLVEVAGGTVVNHLGLVGFRGSYAAVIRRGVIIEERFNNAGDITLTAPMLTLLKIERVRSAGHLVGDKAEIVIDGEDYAIDARGLNVVVLDADGRIESGVFDTYAGEPKPPGVY